MMGFKDKTWCREDTCIKHTTCPRYFNETEQALAREWWGGDDFPLVCWAEKLECYKGEKT